MRRAKNPETLLVEAIQAALAWEPGLILDRLNSGVFGPRHVRAGLGTGCADLVGVLSVEARVSGWPMRPVGVFVALEVKLPTKTSVTTKAQDEWLARRRAAGAFCAVVRSVKEARAAIARARTGATW